MANIVNPTTTNATIITAALNQSTTTSPPTTEEGTVDPDAELTRYYDELAIRIWRVGPPILLVIGTLGNIMSIVVLSRKTMRRSNAAIYLIVLSGVDIIVLYTGLIRYWIKASFNVDVRELGDASCRIHTWMVYVSLDTSVWVLVALTFERLVSVYLPHRVKKYCTTVTSQVTIGVIIVVMLAVNSHFAFGLGNKYERYAGQLVLIQKCAIVNPDHFYFVIHVWPWIDLCLYSLVPLSIVIVSNIAIVVKVSLSRRRVRRVHPRPSVNVAAATSSIRMSQDSNSNKLSSMTAMLVVLNMVLMITTLPVSTILIIEPYVITENATEKEIAKWKILWAMVNILQYTNHSINFLLYCLSGSRFREELRSLFQRRCKVAPLNNTATRVSDVALSRFRSTVKFRGSQLEEVGDEGAPAIATTTTTATTNLVTSPPSRQSSAPKLVSLNALTLGHEGFPPPPSPPPPPPYTDQPGEDTHSPACHSQQDLHDVRQAGDSHSDLLNGRQAGDYQRDLLMAQQAGDSQSDLLNAKQAGDSQRDLLNAKQAGDSQRDLLMAKQTGDSQSDLLNAKQTGDSQRDLLNAKQAGDSQSDLLNAKQTGDSQNDLLNAKQTGDSQSDLLNAKQAGDSHSDLLNAKQAGDCHSDLLNAKQTGDSHSDLLNAKRTGDSQRDMLNAKQAGDSHSDLLNAKQAGDCHSDLLNAKQAGDSQRDLHNTGDSQSDVLNAKRTSQSQRSHVVQPHDGGGSHGVRATPPNPLSLNLAGNGLNLDHDPDPTTDSQSTPPSSPSLVGDPQQQQ